MAAVMPGLRPATSSLLLSARPTQLTPLGKGQNLRQSLENNHIKNSRKSPPDSSSSNASSLTANPNLSVIEIESLLKDKVQRKHTDLQQAFQNYDIDQTLSITKGEFRRVLESFCFPMTTEQFESMMNKINSNPNGTVRYCDFLNKFAGSGESQKWTSGTQRYIKSQSAKEMNTDMVEKLLQEKIQKNLKNVIKGLRLYDYNRDSLIQKHELRKVLENYCFKMSDAQFDKLYQRYDFHHKGVLNYRDFLERLGVHVDKQHQPTNHQDTGAKSAMSWKDFQQQKLEEERAKNFMKRPDDSQLAGLSFNQIEALFRQKMRENFANLKRMFLVFDKNLEGFISLEDLKAILVQFTIPLSDQLFSRLMDKFQIKASGKVSWEAFLEKFQDPQSHGNGQTIPIKPSHKFFPIRGVDEKTSLLEIVALLYDHVRNHYSSFKQAFLEIDKNRNGKVSRKELKKLIERFEFKISEGQFKELMILLDPHHSNFIPYHTFLNLFEERDTAEGHKWLNSVHRYNEHQKPAILPWKTIEEIIRNRITHNWEPFSKALAKYDEDRTSCISAKKFRKLMEKYAIPVSDEHFEKIQEKQESKGQEQFNYITFLKMLGVTIKPGDLEGLSTQIHDGSNLAESKRLDTLIKRQVEIEMSAQDRSEFMTVEEVIVRLKDKISQSSPSIRGIFKKYDGRGKGKINKKDFRKVLENSGFYLKDELFKEVCETLPFENGGMTYADFVNSFEDSRIGGPASELQKRSNHRVNPIRGDEYGVSAEYAISKLRTKLRENFEDLRGAFYKFDDDHNGILTKSNFRRMMDAFMFPMTDEEFEKLCIFMNVDKKSRISYKDFLEAFEVVDTPEGHKWLNSVHRYNQVKPVQSLTAEQVHQILVKKSHQQWVDISKAFNTMHGKKDGRITKQGLKETLYKFVLPTNKEEFGKLWKRYDPEGLGYISYHNFLDKMTADEFAPGDNEGTSKKIFIDSQKTMDEHHASMQAKHEQNTFNQATRMESISVDELMKKLKDRIREQYKDFYEAFKKYDTRKRGYLSVNDFQRILVDFHYFLDDDQLYDLTQRIGLGDGKKKMTYEDFVNVFEEGRRENYSPKTEDPEFPQLIFANLSPIEAESRIKRKIEEQGQNVRSACLALDKEYMGKIKAADFRRVLDNFCFKLTDEQFKHIVSKMNSLADGYIDYASFLETSVTEIINPSKWIEDIQRRLHSEDSVNMSLQEIKDCMMQQVTAKFKAIASGFAEKDYARIGVISRADFRDVLDKHTVRLSDEQFEKFWGILDVNEFDNLEYGEFLRKYCLEPQRPLTQQSMMGQDLRAGTPLGRRPATTSSGRSLHTSHGGRPFTPLVNAEGTEQKLQDKIFKHWKDIQKQCRVYDPENTGQIEGEAIKYILKRYDINLAGEDLNKLLMKYDLKNNNKFCYSEFLKYFVLTRRSSENERGLLKRKKLNPVKIPVSTEEKPKQFDDAMERLRQCVAANWKDMRSQFKASDQDGVTDPNTFRDVLRNFNVNLTEDEFYHLMSYYDSGKTGKINYNDFIRAFIRNV